VVVVNGDMIKKKEWIEFNLPIPNLVPNLGAVWHFCEACMATKP